MSVAVGMGEGDSSITAILLPRMLVLWLLLLSRHPLHNFNLDPA